MSTRVFKFGLLAPTTQGDIDLVFSQMDMAHKFKNKLIEAAKESRLIKRTILKKRDENPKIQKLLGEIEFINQEILNLKNDINQKKIDNKNKKVDPKQKKIMKDLRSQKEKLYKEVKILKKELTEEYKTALKAADKKWDSDKKIQRQNTNTYWGTYNHIEAMVSKSYKDMYLYNKTGKPIDPKFERWTGEGALAIQIQKPVQFSSTNEHFGTKSTLLQFHLKPTDNLNIIPIKRKPRYGDLKFRVTSDPKGGPIFATFPIKMHRSLPPNGVIVGAVIQCKKIADRVKWSLHVTVKEDNTAFVEKIIGKKQIAIDVGWRKIEQGFRIGYAIDDAGFEQEFILPNEIIKGIKYVDKLKSIRKSNQEIMQQNIIDYLSKIKNFPEDFKENIENIGKWKAPNRFVILLKKWENNQQWIKDYKEGFNILVKWYYGDISNPILLKNGKQSKTNGGERHLWQWERNQESKNYNRRKDYYRNIAYQLSQDYSILILENFDLRSMQKNKEVEDSGEENKKAKRQKNVTAISEFRTCLEQAFYKKGGKVFKVPPQNTTKVCNLCGYSGKWKNKSEKTHTCEGCGVTWDRDANAARNIINRYNCERSNAEEKKVNENKGGRFRKSQKNEPLENGIKSA